MTLFRDSVNGTDVTAQLLKSFPEVAYVTWTGDTGTKPSCLPSLRGPEIAGLAQQTPDHLNATSYFISSCFLRSSFESWLSWLLIPLLNKQPFDSHRHLVPEHLYQRLGWVRRITKALFSLFFNPSLRQVPKGYVTRQPQVPPPVFTCARVTWPTTSARPIQREDRCSVLRVSQAETCWFSRRQPLLINCTFLKDSWKKAAHHLREQSRTNFIFLAVHEMRWPEA